MHIKQIRLHELLAFVESDEFQKYKVVPITKERALSQVLNPRADANDIVLTVAYNNNNEVIAYVGALPDLLNNTIKIAWNSCWYANANEGKTISLPIFLQFIKNYNNRVIFQDLTPHTANILKSLPNFTFLSSKRGRRIYFRFEVAKYYKRFFPKLKFPELLFVPLDRMLNSLYNYRLNIWLRKDNSPVQLERIHELDEESKTFIEQNNKEETVKRGISELEWILKYKWVIEGSTKKNNLNGKYHFSYIVESFNYHLLKFKDGINLAGFIILKERDKYFETPYVYINDYYSKEISIALLRYTVNQKSKSLTTFNHILLNSFSLFKYPRLYQKFLYRDIVIGNALLGEVDKNIELQDGDGDVVFT